MKTSAKSTKEISYRVFQVAAGWCAAARTEDGFCNFVLPLPTAAKAEKLLLELAPQGKKAAHKFAELEKAVENYFDGWRTDFNKISLDLSAGTEFELRVWERVRRIPYGKVRSYGWIGMEMGRPEAARAIGMAVGTNPLPLIIPCHRVIASNGTLGGFSAPGGIATKAMLLELERVRLHKSGEIIRVLI